MNRLKGIGGGVLLAVCAMTVALAGWQSRGGPPPLAGTATLSGMLVLDDARAAPVRRATISLAGPPGMARRIVGTDDEGRFVFDALPAGTYTLSATKTGFVAAFYGSRRPGRGPGVPIAIADGAHVDVAFRILAGAVITGVIRDFAGRPVPAVPVSAIDTRTLGAANLGQWATDDRGVYRIFGLAPGAYLVSAVPRLGPMTDGRALGAGFNVIATTDAELQWARAAGTGTARAAMPPPGTSVQYAPVYYPGTPDVAAAAAVTVSAGEERTGVDLPIRLVAVSTISGTIVDAAGQPVTATIALYPRRSDRPTPASALVSSGVIVLPRGSVTPDGFSITGVTPGEYTLLARSGLGQRSAGPSPATPTLWNVTDVSIAGQDLAGLVLRLLPGAKVSGTVAFDPAGSAPPDLSVIHLAAGDTGPLIGTVSTSLSTIDPSGRFTFASLSPGRWVLRTLPADAWMLKSAMVNGRDLADVPSAFEPGDDVSGVIATFTDHGAEISGRVIDAANQPVTRYSIVVFTTNRLWWIPNARRIRLATPATDGSFTVPLLPAGEYTIAAAEDAETTDLGDPAFLSDLLSHAFKLTVGDGEKKRQDVRIGG